MKGFELRLRRCRAARFARQRAADRSLGRKWQEKGAATAWMLAISSVAPSASSVDDRQAQSRATGVAGRPEFDAIKPFRQPRDVVRMDDDCRCP